MYNDKVLKTMSEKDFQTYFYDTFIKVLIPNSDKFRYCCVRGSDGTGNSMVIHLRGDGVEGSYKLNQINVDLSFPECGLYSGQNNEAWYYYRLPTRQYKKGLCSDAHAIKHISRYCSAPINRSPFGSAWDSSTLNQLFLKPNSVPIETSINKVLKKDVCSQQLSRNFAISLGCFSRFPTIWFRRNPIGELVSPKKVVVFDERFAQEGIDFFTDRGIHVDYGHNKELPEKPAA